MEKRSDRVKNLREKKEQRIGDFVIKSTLGKGTFSKVCLAEHRVNKQTFALKFIKPKSADSNSSNDKHSIRIEREIKLLTLLSHPNIVKLYDVLHTPKFTMIVMEHNSGGELLQFIRSSGRLVERKARVFFRQIVSAVDYCHRNCIIHRDLKLENVMLDGDGKVRLIDFGFANTFNWDKQLDTFCGSPFYAAPEMVNGIKYTGPEVDVWSMGVILFFMLCGRTPFEGENLKEIYDKISKGKFDMPQYLTEDAADLLNKMLTVSPKKRITMSEIKSHPWINTDYEEQVNGYLPARPAVVLDPNPVTLGKMHIYGFSQEDVITALGNPDMASTPIVCIYHLVEDVTSSSPVTLVSNENSRGPEVFINTSQFQRGQTATQESRPNPASNYPNNGNRKLSTFSLSQDMREIKESDYNKLSNNPELSSIMASNYGNGLLPSKSKKGYEIRGNIGESFNWESNSARNSDLNLSRISKIFQSSSKVFNKLRKSLPFIKFRKSTATSNNTGFKNGFKRSNKSTVYAGSPSDRRLSAQPPVPPMPFKLPLHNQNRQMTNQQKAYTPNRRATDFVAPKNPIGASGIPQPNIQNQWADNSPPHFNSYQQNKPEFGRRYSNANSPQNIAMRLSNGLEQLNMNQANNKSSPRPSPMHDIAMTDSGASSNMNSYVPISRTESEVSKHGSSAPISGIFTIKTTLVKPLPEIHSDLDRIFKENSILYRQLSEYFYYCEHYPAGTNTGKGNSHEASPHRFEIHITGTHGNIHTIKFKRVKGSWWAHKKLSQKLIRELFNQS
ncbi:hypothetical protein BB560_003226 [Smittium megazygosporum]|uniref:non-specific serine/threonine protein kinase n=1 Tax=Smittium megazygosporum TaxID=133381 RepID=A0A2T9ZCJ4_9FUNG|nr:hypothetical protein BB560_003226 [Smittium megazygosporum]